jgi:S1/P1 Nuclease
VRFRSVFSRIRFAVSVSLIVLTVCAPVFAWNDEGHMAAAYLAYQRLRPAIRNRADSLLKLNPYYSKWLAALPPSTSEADAKMMIFMIAATWPDEIRSDPAYASDGLDNGNTPAGPASSQNIGYADHLLHKYWHFIDIPYSQDGTPLPPIPTPNAKTQISAFRAALSSTASDDVKSYDLSWLEHLVGDIHQPLHAITRVSADAPMGDAGGNLVTLCSAPCRNVLHLFWDRLVGSQDPLPPPPPDNRSAGAAQAPAAFPPPDIPAELKSAISAAKALPTAPATLANKMDESIWVQESFNAAREHVYVPPIGNGLGPFTITQSYLEQARAIARERVALAGVRLANLLSANLK